MSNGTCYAGSNNIYNSAPPLMSDGRNFANWQPGTEIDNILKKQANITNNSEYRQYLIQNADKIVELNQLEACNNCGCCPYYNSDKDTPNKPFLFDNCLSKDKPFGYETSDLKKLYLSREQLQTFKSEPITFKLQ